MLIMKPRIRLYFISLLLVSFVSVPLFSQERTIISPYISLQYFKISDEHRYLQTTLTYSSNRMEIPLTGMEISFRSGPTGEDILGSALTNDNGLAVFDLPENMPLRKDTDGLWLFSSDFAGNDTIEAVSSELSIRDVKLEMVLSQVDTIKTISLKAYTSGKSNEIPVAEEVVMVYVPRMFSLLPVGEAYLDENGTANLEFPSDLPGDSLGNLTIISKFEEHPEFGNVEVKVVKNWGVPPSNTGPVSHRALWTKTPPRWMIITLSILLTGVWGHYLFAVISLIGIKRESKKEKQ